MGTVGWFGLLITGFSYKMLPMFYLAHGLSDRVPRIVLFLWNAAVLAGIAFFLAGDPAAGITVSLGLLALAFFAYNVYVTQVRQARHKESRQRGVGLCLQHPGAGRCHRGDIHLHGDSPRAGSG